MNIAFGKASNVTLSERRRGITAKKKQATPTKRNPNLL